MSACVDASVCCVCRVVFATATYDSASLSSGMPQSERSSYSTTFPGSLLGRLDSIPTGYGGVVQI